MTLPALYAPIWAVLTALTHHHGMAANTREFEAIARHIRPIAAAIRERANTLGMNAGKRPGIDAT